MKNLVIVLAGDGSLHEKYAAKRDFELWICYWGDSDTVADKFAQNCDRFFRIKGQKWELVRNLGRIAREEGAPGFSSYDYVFLPDDDIEFEGGAAGISKTFALAGEIKADIFQPAIANEHYSPGWEPTRRIENAVCRATTVVEIMMPGYSGQIFEHCVLPLLHIRGYTQSGWGIEPLITRFAEAVLKRPVRTFVLDETCAVHTRPVGSGTSNYEIGKDEAFLNPFAFGMKMKELARFQSRQDARRYVFAQCDNFTDWQAVKKHLKRARGARRIHELARKKDVQSFPLKILQKFAARYLRD